MKTIIRESLAMIVLVLAIMLITVLAFFDYIKADANQPQAAMYEATEEEANILEAKNEYESQKSTLVLSSTYSIDASDLSTSKATGEFTQGQSSPFDEIPISDVLYDSAGNIYYQVQSTQNTVSNSTVSGTSTGTVNNTSTTVQNNSSSTNTNTVNTNTVTNNNSSTTQENKTSSTGLTTTYSFNSDVSTASTTSGLLQGQKAGK